MYLTMDDKFMKKFLALMLALILVCCSFVLVSCDEEENDKDKDDVTEAEVEATNAEGEIEKLNGKTAQELYELAYEKMENATNYTVTSSQDITVIVDGQEIKQTQTVLQEVNGDNFHSKTSGVENAEQESWYVDGVLYTSAYGKNVKATMTMEQYYEEYLGSGEEESKLFNIPESWFVDITFEKEDDKYYIVFTVSAEKYEELIGTAGISANIDGDVKYRVYFDKDGNLESMKVDMSMTVNGTPASVSSVSIFSNVGTTAAITAPEGADSFVDVTEELFPAN